MSIILKNNLIFKKINMNHRINMPFKLNRVCLNGRKENKNRIKNK